MTEAKEEKPKTGTKTTRKSVPKTTDETTTDETTTDETTTEKKSEILVVLCNQDGFRRGGRSFTKGTNEVNVDDLTPEQIEQITTEPKLACVYKDAPTEPEALPE